MKKFSVLIAAILFVLVGSSFDSKAIGITIKVEFGKHTPEGNCGPGRGICSITIGGSLRAVPGETRVEVVKGDAVLAGNLLTVKLANAISDKGLNEAGKMVFVVKSPMMLDKATAKSLGVMGVTRLPGKYEIMNNTIVYKVKTMNMKMMNEATEIPSGVK